MIIEQPKGDNLKNCILSLGRTYLKEKEVKKCVSQLLKIVKQLHKMRIKHGNVSLETVNSRNRSKGLKIKLTGFDRATALK